tara:strand:- start:1007 stop:1270 length:264 start_codon:yes stop_codon:yes gene_type:complete
MIFYIVIAVIFGIAIGSLTSICVYNSIIFKKNKKVHFEDKINNNEEITEKQSGGKGVSVYNQLVPQMNHFGLQAFNSGNFSNHQVYK